LTEKPLFGADSEVYFSDIYWQQENQGFLVFDKKGPNTKPVPIFFGGFRSF
jgi:hypothetical protein